MMETGGIESHIKEFCLQMNLRGIEIHLVVMNAAMLPENEQFFKKVCRKVFLCKRGRSYLRIFHFFYAGFLCRMQHYDAIYTNGQGDSINNFMSLIGRKKNWVHHHHTSGDLSDQQTWSTGYRKALKNAPLLIACSKKNAKDMNEVLVRNIETIPCFSRKIKFIPKQKVNDNIKFGYYGRLIPQKGIDHLCRLSEDEDLKNVEFHIWGEGAAYSSEYFLKFPRLTYHGCFHGEDELTEVINSIDAFLLLSIHPEGLPICLLEAMSAGLPWLATNRGGIADIVSDHYSTRLIAANADYALIKKEMLSFINDINENKLSRENQINLYNNKFSSEALASQWKKAFGFIQ